MVVTCVLAGFISKEVKLVYNISHAEIRNIILKHGIKWRQSKLTFGPRLDPDYDLKKEDQRSKVQIAIFTEYILLSMRMRRGLSQ